MKNAVDAMILRQAGAVPGCIEAAVPGYMQEFEKTGFRLFKIIRELR